MPAIKNAKSESKSISNHKSKEIQKELSYIYELMYGHFGARRWWPGETELEICLGAILTQSVSWKNVSIAIGNLKNEGLLDLEKLNQSPIENIEMCIVPTMYYHMKAKKIKSFVNHVRDKHHGSLPLMFKAKLADLREELLSIYGIGPETADSIILYAAQKPIFVVDAYTRRIFSRLGIFQPDVQYDEMQRFFMNHLHPNVSLYNEYHALIVGIGNRFCATKKPKCEPCPLNPICRDGNYKI